MNILPQSKFGDCTQCFTKDTSCVKIGKELVCLLCNKTNKAKKQVQKANQRNKVRGLPHISMEEKEIIDSRNSLIQDLDWVVSRIVRISAADSKTGIAECFTCNKKLHWSLMQNGHFVSRSNMRTRFELNNCRVQCEECNCHKHGNLEVFAERLDAEEQGMSEFLREQSREVSKIGVTELKQLLIELRHRLKRVESKLQK
jgi:hypothetical protein